MRIQLKFTHGSLNNRKGRFAMNNKRKATALVFLLAIIMMASNVTAQDDLTGAWLVNATNTTFGISFESLRTYHAGGTMTEVASALPTLTESPAHGVWERQGNDCNVTFMVFGFDSSGQLSIRIKVHEVIRFISSDSISITWKADVILLNGNIIPNVAEGFGSGARLRVQSLTAVNETPHNAPASFELLQNYPNPFNPSTTIRFEVAKASYVNLKVLDTLGREVRTLVDRSYGPGSYFQVWDGKDSRNLSAPSGTYFLRMNAGGYVDTKKMTLIK